MHKIASLNSQRRACKVQLTRITIFPDDEEWKDLFKCEVKLTNLRKITKKLRGLESHVF